MNLTSPAPDVCVNSRVQRRIAIWPQGPSEVRDPSYVLVGGFLLLVALALGAAATRTSARTTAKAGIRELSLWAA